MIMAKAVTAVRHIAGVRELLSFLVGDVCQVAYWLVGIRHCSWFI